MPWRQNVTAVKDYFGEKIGMYFAFLGHYTTWLIYASIVGFITWIDIAGDNSNPRQGTALEYTFRSLDNIPIIVLDF